MKTLRKQNPVSRNPYSALKPVSAFCILVFALSPLRAQKSNLMAEANGSFGAGLKGWTVRFEGHDRQKGNEAFVSVTSDGARPHVLKMEVSEERARLSGQGVHAWSAPVRIDGKKRYRLTATVRGDGVDTRIYVYGKKFRPDADPGAEPTVENTRNVLKWPIMSFSDEDRASSFSDVSERWATGTVDIPPKKMTKMAYKSWLDCEFLEIHLVGIGGGGGQAYFDDIRVEEVGDIAESDVATALESVEASPSKNSSN